MSEQLSPKLIALCESNFIPDYKFHPVTKEEEYNRVKNALSMDYRAKKYPESGYASVFEGLEFDSKQLRSQAFYIATPDGEPIGVTTFVITPQNLIEQQRYIIKKNSKFFITDFKEVNKINETPKYLIVPAWTTVKPEYKNVFSRSGIRFLTNVINKVLDNAPKNTYIEVTAQGKVSHEETDFLLQYQLGREIRPSLIPTQYFCINDRGSSSSVKIAEFLGLQRIPNVASARSLGPVFVKQVQ